MGVHGEKAVSSHTPTRPAPSSSRSWAGRANPAERGSTPARPASSKRAAPALLHRAPQAAPSSPEIRGCSPRPAGCWGKG